MKASLLAIITFIFISPAFAQNKQSTPESQLTVKLFCQKWMLTTMAAQGQSAVVPASEAMYLTYYSDGKYTDSSARFNVSHGTWSYDSKTQFMHTTEKGGKTQAKIIRVTPSELIMEMEFPTVTMIATYKRVD